MAAFSVLVALDFVSFLCEEDNKYQISHLVCQQGTKFAQLVSVLALSIISPFSVAVNGFSFHLSRSNILDFRFAPVCNMRQTLQMNN